MNCEQMTTAMSAFLDGELTAAEAEQVREHLEQCAECRALFEQLQTLHTSFSDLEEIPAPENFARDVMSCIRAEEKSKVIPLFKRPQVRTALGLAACAVLCIGFGRIALDSGLKDASMEAAAPTALAPESAVAYDVEDYTATQFTSGAGAPRMEDAPAETAVPEAEMPEAPSVVEPAMPEPAEAPVGMQMDGAPAEKTRIGTQIILTRLPDGLAETVGTLVWEERIEDGALCARLTGEQVEKLLDLTNAQGLTVEQTSFETGDTDEWMLVLLP